MNNRFWGIKSIAFSGAGLLIALINLFFYSSLKAYIYLSMLIILPLLIVYFYCTKCLCDGKTCAHYLLGKLSEFLPDRTKSKYNILDYSIVAISVLLILAFPQIELFRNKALFILFWILEGVAFVEINLFVCKNCKNKKCLICRSK
jgi:hypothetical protein